MTNNAKDLIDEAIVGVKENVLAAGKGWNITQMSDNAAYATFDSTAHCSTDVYAEVFERCYLLGYRILGEIKVGIRFTHFVVEKRHWR
jgi:hypothetical protein